MKFPYYAPKYDRVCFFMQQFQMMQAIPMYQTPTICYIIKQNPKNVWTCLKVSICYL